MDADAGGGEQMKIIILICLLLSGCTAVITEDSEIIKIEKSADGKYKYAVTINSVLLEIVYRTNYEYKVGDKLIRCRK